MVGGEIYVKKIPSINLTDIAEAIAPNLQHKIVGIRPGEKLHEQMIGLEDAPYTIEYPQFYKILPAIYAWNLDPSRIKDGVPVSHNFIYSSDLNPQWMSVQNLRDWVKENYSLIGKI
jgi:FlaA1/EpsC-like NDP-sugar epimerase